MVDTGELYEESAAIFLIRESAWKMLLACLKVRFQFDPLPNQRLHHEAYLVFSARGRSPCPSRTKHLHSLWPSGDVCVVPSANPSCAHVGCQVVTFRSIVHDENDILFIDRASDFVLFHARLGLAGGAPAGFR